jgi:fatty acid desaturase
MSTTTIPFRAVHRHARQIRRPTATRTEKKKSRNRSGWRPYLIPTVRGFALILVAFGFWALAAWLGNRIPMVLALACAVLLIGACIVTLCRWTVPVNDHGQFSQKRVLPFSLPTRDQLTGQMVTSGR